MLRGSAEAKIDGKGRLKIPSGFRKLLEQSWGRDVFITSVEGDFALLYPLPIWEEMEARLLKMPSMHPRRRRFVQRVGYFGQQARLDAQGRLVVPPKLRETAAIQAEVVVFGALDHLEIWDKGQFERRLEQEPFTDADFEALTEGGI